MTDYFAEAKSAAQDLKAPRFASPGLVALVAAVRDYVIYCVDLMGSGEPGQAPDFSAEISKPGGSGPALPLTGNTSVMARGYDKNVDHLRAVDQDLNSRDKKVGARVSDVADLTQSTCKKITGQVHSLRDRLGQAKLSDPDKYKPPRYDSAAEGVLITKCVGTMTAVHGDLADANAQILAHAHSIANATPPALRPGKTWEEFPAGFAPVKYGSRISSGELDHLVSVSDAPDAAKKSFITAALQQVGDPYVWGAEGPRAFDCSGLVQYAAEKAGFTNMPRTSEAQYAATQSNPGHLSVTRDELSQNLQAVEHQLKAGDLIFPDAEFNNGSPGHVMIYIGDGQVVEAPHSGDYVKYLPLWQAAPEGFHSTRF
ncbi:MAG: C40 family peptidase [Nocardia sp.]|nr:C40 family peptidase [Nocardia sp.]